MRSKLSLTVLSLLAAAAAPASAQLFTAGDPVLAIDTDTGVDSNYPDAEGPIGCLDDDSGTKYLNFGKEDTGLVVTPSYGASVIQSFSMVTANDAPERDPGSWEIYGTNDPILSEDNSAGDLENWTLIASGSADLPDDRQTAGPVYDFANATSYTSYKIVFPTLKDTYFANSMQVADIYLYTSTGGGGDQIVSFVDDVIAVATFGSLSKYPGPEGPQNVSDGDNFNKYLNFGIDNTGFIITRADNAPVIVEQFTMVTANDFPERDPDSWELYGTNDTIVSEDNSTGDAENWTFIDSGFLALTDDRNTVGDPVSVNNSTAYTSYKMIIPSIKNPDGDRADSMQVADIIFEGQGGGNDCYADCNEDDVVNTQDFICFLNKWSAATGSGTYDPEADCNDDNTINTQDFICFLNAWTTGC